VLGQATPTHIYKSFPPEHKAFAASSVKEKTVPSEPVVQTAVQTEVPVPVKAVEPTPPAPITGCGSDPNMAYIYTHESGCNTASINASSGACGLGQALPCSKLPCTLSDWDCQNSFFVTYAIERYGSTYAAMLAWQAKSWW